MRRWTRKGAKRRRGWTKSPLTTTYYLSTPSPLRGTHPCLRGRKWMLGYCRNIMNIFTPRQQTVPLRQGRRAKRRGWIRKHSPLTFHLSPLTFRLMSKANNSVICTLYSVICNLSPLTSHRSSLVFRFPLTTPLLLLFFGFSCIITEEYNTMCRRYAESAYLCRLRFY